MRRVIKLSDSEVLTKKLTYNSKNSNNNRKITDILLKEQKVFCAYTDEYLSRTDSSDIEHFNPTVKGTSEDNYYNWFIVKHQWNKEKGKKWHNFQPLLHPTAIDLEERIVYNNGDYIAGSLDDIEALNLIELLKLNDPILAKKRKTYIKRYKDEMELTNKNPKAYFTELMEIDLSMIAYLRAIKEEFKIDLWEILE